MYFIRTPSTETNTQTHTNYHGIHYCKPCPGVPAQNTPPPPTELYPGIFWVMPGYKLEYTLWCSLGAPRLYPRVYSGSSQSILHKPRLYPIKFRVGYSLGDRGILCEIVYMVTINYQKLKIYILNLWGLEYHMSPMVKF